jgi:hypothetical protein
MESVSLLPEDGVDEDFKRITEEDSVTTVSASPGHVWPFLLAGLSMSSDENVGAYR